MIGLTSAPASVRGTLKEVSFHNDTTTYENAVDESGSGKLFFIYVESIGSNSMSFLATIDGIAYNGFQVGAGVKKWVGLELTKDIGNFTLCDTPQLLNYDFKTQLNIRIKTLLAGQDVVTKVIYAKD